MRTDDSLRKKPRLALFAVSPDHTQAPLYRRIAAEPNLEFTAIFASSAGIRPHDWGYGRSVIFDTGVTAGYRSVFLKKADTNSPLGTSPDPPFVKSFLSLLDLDVVGKLLRARYDALWLHGYNSATHALAALTQRATSGNLLIREDQTLLHPRSLPKTLMKEAALRPFFSNVSALYTGTHNKLWFEHYGVPSSRLFFAPHCVDNERLQEASAELRPRRRELQDELGVNPESTPVILTVSRLLESKRADLLLEAFKCVRARRPCTLLVVGTGECEQALKRTVQRERIPDVVFTGFLDQATLPRAYALADVFALFSDRETWGLVVNEAMNFELPIVVSDKVGCSADIVQDGRNGFVVRAGDTTALAERLAVLVDNDRLRRSFGAKSLKLIEPWNYDNAARGVLEATVSVVASG